MLETPRTRLVVLPPPLVAALAQDDLEQARLLAPFPLHDDVFGEDAYVLRLRHAQLEAAPDPDALAPWLLRAVVSRETGEVVGRIGFHDRPDADGTVEVGYAIDPASRRQGLALEVCRALFAWGAEHGAQRVLASVRPDNEASLAVVRRLGFVKTGEEVDDVDGLEWVHTLELGR